MTGLGYKQWNAGDVLQAVDLNGYVADQVVMYFPTTAARSSAIGTPSAGMMSYIAASSAVNVYDGVSWVEISGGGGVTVGTAAPTPASEGDLWWDSDDGKLYVYYDDGTSQQWVDAAGPSVAVQATPPTGYQGQLWLDSDDGSMYVYYTDPGGTASSWIGAVSRSGGVLQVVSTTKTDTFSTTSTSFVNVTGVSATITPRSTSSKILVIVNVGVGTNAASTSHYLIARDSTAINVGDAAGSRVRANFSTRAESSGNSGSFIAVQSGNIMYLDSPATTSSVTYNLQMRVDTGTGYIGRSGNDADNTQHARTPANITLIEVAG